MKAKVKRPGSGRKKGQLCKVDSSPNFVRLARMGYHRKDVCRVYEQLRAISLKIADDATPREFYHWLQRSLHGSGGKSTEVFEALFGLVNAMRKRDADFFKRLSQAVDHFDANDRNRWATSSPPPADKTKYWFAKLAEYYHAESVSFCPPFFGEQLAEILRKEQNQRPPLSIKLVRQFITMQTGEHLSDATISDHAKRHGVPLNPRFGKPIS